MKKKTALLLVLAGSLLLTSCSNANQTSSSFPIIPSKPVSSTSGKPDPSAAETFGTTIESNLWTLSYDPDVWVYEEYDFTDHETWSNIMMIIPEENGLYTANVEIRASIEDAVDFRDKLIYYGFDQQDYVDGVYHTVSVGGVDCLMQEGEYWGDPAVRYLNRVEGAGATVFVEIIGDYEDPRVEELLSGLHFDLKDTGNTDGPWPWEGTPFSGETRTVKIGAHSITAEWIPIDEPIVTNDIFNHSVAVIEDTVYLFGDDTLKEYAFDGTSLTYEEDVLLSGNYEAVQATQDGTLWLSGLVEPLAAFENGKMRANYEGPSKVSMHPSGEWGISWFYTPECEIIRPDGDSDIMHTAPIPFSALSYISSLNVDEDYIYVCGDSADGSGHKVYIYTWDGTLRHRLTDANGDSLGNITYMTSTPNGFIGLDSNRREIVLWTDYGEYIGAIDDSDLFGTDDLWFCHAAELEDRSLLILMTNEREDHSAIELIAYKLSGF